MNKRLFTYLCILYIIFIDPSTGLADAFDYTKDYINSFMRMSKSLFEVRKDFIGVTETEINKSNVISFPDKEHHAEGNESNISFTLRSITLEDYLDTFALDHQKLCLIIQKEITKNPAKDPHTVLKRKEKQLLCEFDDLPTTYQSLLNAADKAKMEFRKAGYFLTFVDVKADETGTDKDKANISFKVYSGKITGFTVNSAFGNTEGDWTKGAQNTDGFPQRMNPDDEKNARKLICKRLERLKKLEPVTRAEFERIILLADDLPGISINVSLRPGSHQGNCANNGKATNYSEQSFNEGIKSGDTHLFVNISALGSNKYKSSSGSFQINNSGSEYVGPIRGITNMDIYNPFWIGEEFHFNIFGNLLESGGIRVNTKVPLMFPDYFSDTYPGWLPYFGNDGLKLSSFIQAQKIKPGHSYEYLDIEVDQSEYGIFIEHSPLRSYYDTIRIMTGLHRINNNSEISRAHLQEEQLSVHITSAEYNHKWDNDRFSGYILINSALHHGIDIDFLGDVTLPGSVWSPRPEADPNFYKITNSGTLFLDRPLKEGNGFPWSFLSETYLSRLAISHSTSSYFLGEINWQWSGQPLLPSEEMIVGGSNLGRGYQPGEIAGDRGLSSKLELGFLFLCKDEGTRRSRVYGFLDYGNTHNLDVSFRGTDNEKKDIMSTGLGIYFPIKGRLFITTELAKPLNLRPETEPNKDPRFYINADVLFW
ncbi:MAG: ShlB/FhaC/HecB family hemolysin secretion/activation protein [Magnetococcales bacterium]|nr:ShlB/FhaC/HecB family hemolysin secretion/activation protein [Magnetococcales bacterium]